MEQGEREWLDAAINKIVAATEKKVLVLIARRQDDNDGFDAALTNAVEEGQMHALAMAANGGSGSE